VQVSFHELERSEALESVIRAKAAKLESFHPRVQSLHVFIEKQSRHMRQGNLFEVRLEARPAGCEPCVWRAAHQDAGVAVRDAFDSARRGLDQLSKIVQAPDRSSPDPETAD
jgi:ribosome-associated translation inhibitor RaiA